MANWNVLVRFPEAGDKMASGGCVKQELLDFTKICFTVEKPSFFNNKIYDYVWGDFWIRPTTIAKYTQMGIQNGGSKNRRLKDVLPDECKVWRTALRASRPKSALLKGSNYIFHMQHHTRFLYPVAFGITTRPKSVLDRVSYTSTTSMFRHYRNINPSLL